MVALSFQGGSVSALQSDTFVELGQLPAQALGDGSEVFIGGHPNSDSAELWGGYFKGCLQDIQLNSHRIQFFQVENNTLLEELNRTQTGNLVNGCISDDTCKVCAVSCLSLCMQGFVVVLLLHKSLTASDTRKRRSFFLHIEEQWLSVLPPHSIGYI